nr:VrlC protein [uncultured Mediterranean phage uvMED]
MPSPTDFNLSPYYDDFNESKKFHRILFRPAFAVQARELTQSQTQLQNQVERVSDHLFEKGAMVIPGEVGYDLNYSAIKLSAKSNSTLADYNGVEITGATSGVVAKVVGISIADGTDPDTLFVKYIKTGTDNTSTQFTATETLDCMINSVSATATVASVHTGAAAQVQEGVYYINGYHVQVSGQTIVLDKYTNTPSYRVGLTVTESFVTPNDDASINDNAQGTSNVNAPGAHRFKILLTLNKKSLTATDDANFVELLRLKNGIIQNQVRTTQYAVIEDTFARRTFDESGDYAVRDFDLDLREHLLSGNNRGIYTSASGGLESKIAAGLSPGKAYVRGYEIETIGTSFVDINKTREFNTENNFKTRFELGNYFEVNNVYGSPDVGFVSGDTEAFKSVNLYDTATAVRGTPNVGAGSGINTIGRAKSRGFEYSTGTASNNIFTNGTLTSAVYKHYLFDIETFTHLNILQAQSFTTGETVTGSTSGATATVQQMGTAETVSINNITAANPGQAQIASTHNLVDGQQITIAGVGSSWAIDSTVETGGTFTVREADSANWYLYKADGTTSVNVTNAGSGGTATHGVVIVSNVQGEFTPGETITGGTSSNTATIQADTIGFKGVRNYGPTDVKQITMSGSPAYTADVKTKDVTLTGTVSNSSGTKVFTGNGTRFTDELKVGDKVSYRTDNGLIETKIVGYVISDTSFNITSNSGANVTKSSITRGRGEIKDANKNISIFEMPNETVKTLKTTANSGITDTNFSIRRHFTATLSSNGDASITAGTNETFSSLVEKDFSVSVMSMGSGTAAEVGAGLSLSGNNHEGDPIFVLSGSPTGKTLTLDFGANYAGHKVKILATINRSVAGSKTKTLNSATTLQVATQSIIESGTIGLGKADVYQIDSIKMAADFSTNAVSGDTDITDRFNLDTGQRDNYYDIGRLNLKTGALTPTGRLLVTFSYFSHGSGDYFDVDSYGGIVAYENIPSYVSDTTGKEFKLRDSLDFRPRVDDASTIDSGNVDRTFDGTGASTTDVVKFGTDITSDFEYYLPRIDKVFLDKEGNFKIVEGASALVPQVPKTLEGAMHLYTLELPSYVLTLDDIIIKKVDNRRYTMRDIGKLENRIENMEYYTQLSMLETQAQNLQIQDVNGFDRFKNGIIVDNFSGHNIGDVGNVDYKSSIDMAQGELRPMFNEDAVKLIEADDDGTAILASDRTSGNYQKTGDCLTLPFTESALITQPFASKSVNVNPFDVFTWSGTIDLTPPSDEWKETERAPELVINNVGGFDTLVSGLGNNALNGVEIGTVWNDWQDFWTGTPRDVASRDVGGRGRAGRRVFQRTEVETAQGVQQSRTGMRNRLVPQVVRNSIGDRIVSVAFVPFVRSRTITFAATRLKPNTRVYPYFDNIDVSSYCTPSGGSLGGNIVSDASGACGGTFAIPDPTVNTNPRWRTGQRVFRLTSSPTNDTSSDVETSGEADYVARGILETVQNTIISTREPRLVRNATTENRSITRTSTRQSERTVGWVDPLAQTFMIDDVGGVFLTSVDLFFGTKDSNIPVTVQIREVVNGYPGSTILPFSEVSLNPSSVNISADGTTATKFNFASPVYLQENTEYCFVVLANSNEYTAYVGRLGETVIGSDRTISQQPYAGVMFKSQNGSTWTAEQNEDIKFTLNRAEFSNVVGRISLVNDDLPTRKLKNNPIRTTNGSDVVRVYHPNHGMHSTSNNVTIAGVPSGTYNGLAHSSINGTYTSISNITLDSYDIQIPGSTNATSSGDIGSNTVTATQNRLYDVLNLNVSSMNLPGTSVSYKLRDTTGKSVHGSESEFSLTSVANSSSIVQSDNIYMTAPGMVASTINETNEMAGIKSLFVNVEMSTTNTKLSPVIDLQRASAYVIQNRLNSPTSGNTPDFVSDTTKTGTSTAGVYLTRPIVLENNSTALDIRLTANIRSSSEIKLFFRTSGASEVRKIEDLSWIPFNTDGSADTAVNPSENDSTFKEHKYSVSGLTDFTSFQIKIVMKGTVSSYAPRIKDMRGIALAI